MSFFGLPNNWVYVVYEDGKEDNVANQDTLTEREAMWFRSEWEVRNNVRKVELRNSCGKVLKDYCFN